MTLLALGLIVGGIATSVVSWSLTRANRLTFGLGAAHALVGIILVLIGVLWDSLLSWTQAPALSPATSLVVLAMLLGLLILVFKRALDRAAAIMKWRSRVADMALQSSRKQH
jgi:hypothetical protein